MTRAQQSGDAEGAWDMRAHLAAIVDSSDDAILSKTLEGIITSWNKAAERLYGYTAAEAVGRPITILVPEDRPHEVPGFLEQLRRGERIEHYETIRVAKDGRHIPVAVTISPIRGRDGNVVGASTIARDMSELRRAQQELAEARDRALEASSLKSEFLANMSHEIRTPLNGVIGMTSVLLDTDLSPEQHEYVGIIRNSGEILLTVINDILDFSKIEAGQMDLETIEFDLRSTVEEATELLAERAYAKNVELATLIEPDVPAAVCGDPGRLRQVLVNLVGNAVKFTAVGEVVTRVRVAEARDDSILLHFEVEDTGVGIPRAAQARLFDSFSQADPSSTRRFEGTGLGLAISKKLAELMNGSIGVESEEGKGSRFWFTARLRKGSRRSLPSAPPSEELQGRRVLVVDDNATNRTVLEQTLLAWNLRPTSAEDGEAALEMLRGAVARGDPYAVALLDFQMPGVDGLELARRIKRDPTIDSTPLVLVTSSGQRSEARAAAEAGIEAYLTKPVRRSALHDVLATILAQEHSRTDDDAGRQRPADLDRAVRGNVLVVEDNAVNQKVAVLMLGKLGYRSDVAANGREAVEMLSRIPYAAVLMDCHMPEMDGYEAAREIRKMTGPVSATPIIAMTAEAMAGDEDRARAAGMDDYVSKPVKQGNLAAALERWVGKRSSAAALASSDAVGREDEPILDADVLASLRELAGEEEPDQLVMEFLEGSARILEELRDAVGEEDPHRVRMTAHSLQGSVATLGARGMAEMCARMQLLASNHELVEARALLSRIEEEFDRIAVELGGNGAPSGFARTRSTPPSPWPVSGYG